MSKEKFDTKVTKLKQSLWGCRVLLDGEPVVEVRVTDHSDIQPAFKDMFRTLDKLGADSKMANRSRHRDNGKPCNSFKFIWYR